LKPSTKVIKPIAALTMDTANSKSSWQLGNAKSIPLDRPRLMAIVNTTPDSFSDSGAHLEPASAVRAAARFIRDGADMLDIGGESTRPGATRVSADDQISRVVPVIAAIREAGIEVPISIDTTLSQVAAEALDAGADAINDVSGGQEDRATIELASRRGCGLVLMHRLRPPDADRFSDQYAAGDQPAYTDVVADVRASLTEYSRDAVSRGVLSGAILLDPGLGFGKTVEQNLALIRGTKALLEAGFPLLGAASRKSFTGRVSMGSDDADPPGPADRLGASIALSIAQLLGGVRLFRVHDVREQARALRAAWRTIEPENPACTHT